MKKVFLASILVFLLSFGAMAQGVVVGDYPLSSHWCFDIKTLQLNFFGIQEGDRGSAEVNPMVKAGVATTFYWGNKDVRPEYDAVIAFNVPTVFVGTNQAGDFSIMPAITIGVLDNQFCIGWGWDLSTDRDNKSRSTWLVAWGIPLGKN